MALESPKLAYAVFAVTGGTGTAEWFNWIPSDIGKLAALIAAISSLVLLYIQVRRYLKDSKKKDEDI